MACQRFPILDADTILDDLERKVRLHDLDEEEEDSWLLRVKVELTGEQGEGNSLAGYLLYPAHGYSGPLREKLEKQGSLLSGDKPGPLSVPLAITSLSPLRIAAMSESELKTVLPELVAILQQGEMSRKPDWWPHSTIPWTPHCISAAVKSANTACLRGLVSQCYSYLTQHSVQLNPDQPRIPPQPRVLDWLNSHPPSRSCVQPVKNCGISATKRKLKDGVPYLDIHLCYHCNKEFAAPETLHKHQVQCSGGSLVMSVPSTPPASDSPSPTPPTTASDDTSVSGATLSQPQSSASSSSSSSTPSQPSFSKFVAALDMVPVHRARKILQARRRNTECKTIDLEEPKTPISPPTPRTPKLLISLLSRDGGASSSSSGGSGSHGASSRRRLSYLRQSVDRQEDKGKEGGEAGSDEESSDSGADDTDEPKLHKKSLFSIDVTSGLGQRVLRHMTLEGHTPVVLDCEQFCRTPIKDKYQDRLRTRQLSYPVTWKCTGKRQRQQTHYHLYNFTRAQTFEFMEKMRTGLNWRCRKLLRCIRKSSVVVKRLSAKTLRKWKPSLNKVSVPLTRLTEKEISMWTGSRVVRDHPGLSQYLTVLAIRVDQALKRQDSGSKPQCTKKAPNRNVFNGLSKSSRATTRRVPNIGSSGRSKVQESLPVEKTPSSTAGIVDSPGGFKSPRDGWLGAEMKTPLKIDIPSVAGSARGTKNSPLDDSFSVMTVSSSDEENSRKGVCCALCSVRNRALSPSQRLALPATSRPCSHSPASSCSLGSSAPADLSSPASLSLAGSPSPLSPLSLSAHSSSQSWVSAVKCGGGGAHCESPFSPSSSASVSGTGQDCPKGSPTVCTRTGSSSVRKDSRTHTMQNGVVLKGSENPTHAKMVAPRSRNRSVVGDSRKVDVSVSSAGRSVCVSSSRDRKEVTLQGGTREMCTSVSRQTTKTRSMGQHTGDSSAVHCRQQTTVLDRRGASPERTQWEWKSESRSDSGNTDESCEKKLDKAWCGPDGTEWGQCNGSGGHKGQSQEEHGNTSMPRKGTLNGSMDCNSDMASSSPDQSEDAQHQRKVLRVEVEEEEGLDLKFDGDERCRTWVDGRAYDSTGSCGHTVLGSNPFILSQTQTPLSAHCHWTSPQTSSSGENDAENSFQLGNVKSSCVTSVSVNSDSPESIGPAPLHISHHTHSSHKLLQVSQCSPAKTDPSFQSQKETSPPARKLLSALQMLSVLESARSKTSPGKSRGSGESSGKRKKNKNRCGWELGMAVSAKVGYQTRSQEPLFGARPRKMVDRLQGVDFKRGSKQTLSAIQL